GRCTISEKLRGLSVRRNSPASTIFSHSARRYLLPSRSSPERRGAQGLEQDSKRLNQKEDSQIWSFVIQDAGWGWGPASDGKTLFARPAGSCEASPQGARSQGGAGWHPVDRGPDRRAREGQGRQGGAWRVRERMPRLLRRAGYLLRRYPEGRRPGLSADCHRHIRQGRLCQTL